MQKQKKLYSALFNLNEELYNELIYEGVDQAKIEKLMKSCFWQGYYYKWLDRQRARGVFNGEERSEEKSC